MDNIISKSIDSIEAIRDNKKNIDYNLFANSIDENLRKQIESDSVKVNISYFQRKIKRDYELRVIAFGDYVYPFKIKMDNYDVDWRRIDPDSIVFELENNESVINKCRLFLQKAELKYGAFDLIVDKKGEVFFIECNPNGQFLFCDINQNTSMVSNFVKYIYE